MLPKKKELVLSEFSGLYDILIPNDHILRKFQDLVDFEFIYNDLKEMYCDDNGATAYDPIFMFKLLLLKVMYPMSDRDLVERATFDMSFKYFLDVAPEATLIHPSSLSKFRKLRLKDETLLNKLISKTVELALSLGLIKSKEIIVDSTHTCSIYKNMSPVEILIEQSKQLRKTVYNADETYTKKMPEKPKTNELHEHIEYCNKLVEIIKNDEKLYIKEDVKLKTNLLEEIVSDDVENLNSMVEEDAKVGHKSADTSFFGYKTHIAMTPERIITAAVVTTGDQSDGKQSKELIEKSRENGIDVKIFNGDGAYSDKDNIQHAKENGIKLVSKLSKAVTDMKRPYEGFEFNKDADLFVCRAGHMALRKALHGKKKHKLEGTPLRETHYFDVEKCKTCPFKDDCGYKEGQASKTYTVTLKKDAIHEEHERFQETEEFKAIAKRRYMIEAKNSELKNSHGFKKCISHGLLGMHIQAATTIFVVNLKRIITLM